MSALFTNYWNSLTYKSDIYKAFVNLEESFWEGLFYMEITNNLLIYLQMLHE